MTKQQGKVQQALSLAVMVAGLILVGIGVAYGDHGWWPPVNMSGFAAVAAGMVWFLAVRIVTWWKFD